MVELSPQAIEFGTAMREMRIAHGRELAEVAETLRIRQAFLQAIEDGRFNDLPGPAYAGGFVRAYADYLGLDVPEVMRRFREATGPEGAGMQSALVPPSPMAEGRMPTGFILLVAVILGGLVYGGWYYLTLNGRDAGEVVAELPRQLAEMVGMQSKTPMLEPAPAPMPAAPTATAVPPTAASEAPAAATPTEPPAAPPPISETSAAPEPAPQPAPQPEPAPVSAAQAAPEPAPEPTPAPMRSAETQPEPALAPAARVAPEPTPAPEPAPVARATPEPAPEPAARPEPAPEPVARPEPAPEPVARSEPAPEPAPPAAAPAVPAPVAEPVPAAPARTRTADAAASVAGRVVLRATAASWVELRDADNRRVFSQVMRAGETYNVPAGRAVTLTTGNAGGLDILVDGQAIPSLGPVGDVRRDISLEPEALLSRLQR